MRSEREKAENEIPIADFRIEEVGDTSRVFFRRYFGWEGLVRSLVMLAFLALGAVVLSHLLRKFLPASPSAADPATAPASAPTARGSQGMPCCGLSFALAFCALWLSDPIRRLAAYVRGWRGRELWTFGPTTIVPASSPLNEREEFPLAETVWVGVAQLGQFWAVGVSTGGRDLLVGPFMTKTIAEAFKNELRQRRPAWVGPIEESSSPASTTPTLGIAMATSDEPAEAILSFELARGWDGADDFDVVLHRASSPRRRRATAFLAIWLCAWLAGEVFVAHFLFAHFNRPTWLSSWSPSPTSIPSTTARSANKQPPVVFLSCWLAFWTYGGTVMIPRLVMHLRKREVWRFRATEVVATPCWRFPKRRTLVDDGQVHARVVRHELEIEFASNGVTMSMGPFADEADLRRAIEALRQRRRSWVWERADP